MKNSIRRISYFVFPVLLACLVSCSPAEKVSNTDLKRYIDSVAMQSDFNGNVLGAVDDEIIYRNHFGLSNFYTNERLNDSSIFMICSISKQFTAMGIMILKEKGLLDYEDDVRKYIPELPYEGITIRNMLTHTSGLPPYDQLLLKSLKKDSIANNDDIIRMLVELKPPLLSKPGERWEYSDTAYEFLATVIERVSGASYGDFLNDHIFKPLRMNHTFNCITRRKKKQSIENYALPFICSDSLPDYVMPDSLDEYRIVSALDGTQGAGSINSTVDDMYKWYVGLAKGKIVSNEILKEAFTPVHLSNGESFNYGFGWFINESQTNKVIMHSGSWYGYKTFDVIGLDRKNFVVVLSNNESDSYSLARKVFEKINREELKRWP